MTLPKGTIVNVNGIPLVLAQDTEADTHSGNAPLVRGPCSFDTLFIPGREYVTTKEPQVWSPPKK